MITKARMSITVSPSLAKAVREQAEAENKTISEVMECGARTYLGLKECEHCEGAGWVPTKDKP